MKRNRFSLIFKRKPLDIKAWSTEFLQSFPDIQWEVSEGKLDKFSYIDHVYYPNNDCTPIIVSMWDVDGIYIGLGRDNYIVEQENDICVVIDKVKNLINNSLAPMP